MKLTESQKAKVIEYAKKLVLKEEKFSIRAYKLIDKHADKKILLNFKKECENLTRQLQASIEDRIDSGELYSADIEKYILQKTGEFVSWTKL